MVLVAVATPDPRRGRYQRQNIHHPRQEFSLPQSTPDGLIHGRNYPQGHCNGHHDAELGRVNGLLTSRTSHAQSIGVVPP